MKDCEEYLPPRELIFDCAKENGFEIAVEQNLSNFIIENITNDIYKNMLSDMAVIGPKAQNRNIISNSEWEAIQLYKVLIFKRT